MVRIIMTYGILSKLNWPGIIYKKTQDFILIFSVHYDFYTTFSGVIKVVIIILLLCDSISSLDFLHCQLTRRIQLNYHYENIRNENLIECPIVYVHGKYQNTIKYTFRKLLDNPII